MPISLMDEFGIIDRDKDYTNLPSIPTPDWAKSSVIYEVYIRSFSKDSTITAFTKRLPELKELGIDTIWLMPIHPIGLLKRKRPPAGSFNQLWLCYRNLIFYDSNGTAVFIIS